MFISKINKAALADWVGIFENRLMWDTHIIDGMPIINSTIVMMLSVPQ